MAEEVDTRVTLSLHPLSVTKIDGYSEKTAVYITGTKQVLNEAYSGVSAVFAAREAANRDPTLNEPARIIKTDDMAQRVFAKVAKLFDTERGNLERGIAHLEAQLTAAVTAKAAHPVAAEIRAYVKALPNTERATFIRSAILNGDVETASSCLGAPSYLCGIDDKMKAVLVRTYHVHNAPDEAAKLTVMQGAKALIDDRGGLLFSQMENAVGAQPHEVRKLREAKARSDRAFAL